ncbi:MAG TPA: hypothetical protein VHE99_11270 [Gammaproteobacteria bacterium]|nr:hypothetical protein [Gammaproteobacteria bacterium]
MNNRKSISENDLFAMYLKTIVREPKPESMTKTLYITCLAINILEQTGNKFPTQIEIDAVEANLKKYSRRKSVLKKAA